MSERYKRYSVEFKREALRRMESCRGVSALALELGIRRKSAEGREGGRGTA